MSFISGGMSRFSENWTARALHLLHWKVSVAKGLGAVCLLLLCVFCVAPASASGFKAFPVRALHLTFRPRAVSMKQYRQMIDQAAQAHYTMLIFHTGGVYAAGYKVFESGRIVFNHKVTHEQVSQLVDYVRKAGMEPVFAVKVIGKHGPILSSALKKKHPGLLVNNPKNKWDTGVLNAAYHFPDGRDAYDAIELPMLDNFIALHGKTKPRYMLLGIDEIPVDGLAICAKAMHTTPAKLFANLINRCVEHLLAKGITPIMWGDMFLSAQLGRPGHGVKGFVADPRITRGNASYLNKSAHPPSVLTAMNDLKHRDQIIIADWHYSPGVNGEYPSVDYFQAMGFKDVWGATWNSDEGIRQFSLYAAKRGCGGMIATTWHMSFSPVVVHNFPKILTNSSVYFRNPAYRPIANPVRSFELFNASAKRSLPATEKVNGVFARDASQLSYVATLDPKIQPHKAVLMIRDEQLPLRRAWKTYPLHFDVQSHRLTGHVALPEDPGELPHAYSLLLRFLDRNGYMVQRFDAQYFQVVKQQPAVAGPAREDVFVAADFSQMTASDFKANLFYTTGQFPLLMKMIKAIRPKGVSETTSWEGGALDCQQVAAWSAAAGLWEQISTRGMRLTVTFKLTSELRGKRGYTALVSMGSYNAGFRFLVAADRTLLLQFANQNDGQPIWITCPGKIKLNEWQTVYVTLSPRVSGKKRQATLQFNQDKKVVVTLPRPISPHNTSVLGFGVEFRPHSSNRARTWALLPGEIRRVEIKAY